MDRVPVAVFGRFINKITDKKTNYTAKILRHAALRSILPGGIVCNAPEIPRL